MYGGTVYAYRHYRSPPPDRFKAYTLEGASAKEAIVIQRAWLVTNTHFRQLMGFGFGYDTTYPEDPKTAIAFPLWVPLVVGLILPLYRLHKWRQKRSRRRTGLCVGCGYDLRATPERCPECGLTP